MWRGIFDKALKRLVFCCFFLNEDGLKIYSGNNSGVFDAIKYDDEHNES